MLFWGLEALVVGVEMSGKSRKEQLEEMLRADPNDSFLRYGLAMEYAGAGQDGEAAAQLLELLRLDPEYVPGYLQAGRVLIRLGRDDQARAVLQSGIGVATRKGDSHAAGELTGFLQGIED
jgi:predicted Zn-dependent protease